MTGRDSASVEDERAEIVSVQRAGRRLGVDPRRLREAIRDGALQAYQPGVRAWYVRWADVLRWLGSQRVRSSSLARDRAREILADDARKERL